MDALTAITLFQAAGSVISGSQQAGIYKAQAAQAQAQARVNLVENDRRVAVEKQSAAEASLERTKKLQRILGQTLVTGAKAGIGAGSSIMSALNDTNKYEYSLEQAIEQNNLQQRITSLNLNSSIDQYNLKSEAASLKAQASSARLGGYINAGTTMFNYWDKKSKIGTANG